MSLPPAPPKQFNFAQYLIAANNSRKEKLALIDDVTSLSYAALADQVRACAAGAQAILSLADRQAAHGGTQDQSRCV